MVIVIVAAEEFVNVFVVDVTGHVPALAVTVTALFVVKVRLDVTVVNVGLPEAFVRTMEAGVPSAILAPTEVILVVTTFEAKVVPVSVPAGAITALPPAAVTSPLPFTVMLGIDVEDPKDPTLELTVAKVVANVPDVVISPDKSPFVMAVDPENFVKFPAAGDPVVVTVPVPVPAVP